MPRTRTNINIIKIRKDFIKLLKYIKPLSAPQQISRSQQGTMIIQDGYGFIILSDGITLYESIINEFLLVTFFQTHYSEAQLKTELNRLIINYDIEKDSSKKKRLLNSFEQDLKSKNKNWIVVLPVEGIKLEGIRSVKIGNCILRPYSSYQAKKLSYDSDKLKININKDNDPRIEFVGQKSIVKIGLSEVNAFLELKTSDPKPVQVGILRLEEYLNILRLFLPILEIFHSYIYMGIKGLRPAIHNTFYAKETNTTRYHVSSLSMGKYETLVLNKQQIKTLRKNKLKQINNLYGKEIYDLDDFEKRLRNSINSFGRGITELNSIEKFLSYMISIESLIGVDRGGLSEHFCLVMNKIFTHKKASKNKKLESYRHFNDLYRIRSIFVHSGSDYIDESFVKSAQHYALNLIFYMLRLKKRISKNEDRIEYLRELKLK